MKFLSIAFFISFVSVSCSKEDPKWTSFDLTNKMLEMPNGAHEVVMTEENTPISQCVGYGQRCIVQTGKIFKVGIVTFIAVEFASTQDAWFAARELQQFYSRNWLFDDVRGEPSLEAFVKERFEARMPRADEEGPGDNSK